MSASKISVRFAAVVVGLFSVAANIGTVQAEEVRFTSVNSYSLAVPEGWEQSPDEVVRQLNDRIASNPNAPKYDAALQPRLGQGETMVGVMVVPNSQLGFTGPLSDDAIQELINTMTGLDLKELAKQSANPETSAALNGAKISAAHWDAAKRRFTWSMESELPGSGRVKVTSAMYFGNDVIVQVSFRSPAESWNENWTVCGQLFESFRFESGNVYSQTRPQSLSVPNGFYIP